MIPPRTPKYPPKTAQTLHTAAEIAQARRNIAQFPDAKKLAEAHQKEADVWLEWSDADLRRLITSAEVPRAFDVGASIGCPKCGLEIHQKFGTYPWLVDLHKPFKLTCPVDGSVYPSNDYAAYYESGFQEKKGWDTAFIDDGWGWKNPKNGERYWFVAHYNHHVWHKRLFPGVRALGQAYVLTGDSRYAQKAFVMLHRMAEVYPAMNHERQSRYGQLMAQRGVRYAGKVLNLIWETQSAISFTEAYDAIFETIADPKERAFIEANLLEDAVDAYFNRQIQGNFGMHQNALAHLASVRQFGDPKWVAELRIGTGDPLHTGFEYALYNLVFRDGMPDEGAPGYNYLWIASLAQVAAVLKRTGYDLLNHPKMQRMLRAVQEQVVIGKHTPNLGDSGSVQGGIVGASNTGRFTTYASLFAPPPPVTPLHDLPPPRSRLLDGGGLAILNDPKDTTAAVLTYGLQRGHGHFDRLSFELFAFGVPLLPDLGYPDAMNDFVPGIYTWSKNTIAHNTVVVDAQRQSGNVTGAVRLFGECPFARVVSVDAPGTYAQTTLYRRTLLMVDHYFLDVFELQGGSQHDYSLHGPPGESQLCGVWTSPAPGTLAGESVPRGQFYDDPVRGKPGYTGGFSGYTGSGFQHLTQVQRHQSGEAQVIYRHAKQARAQVRLVPLLTPGTQLLSATAAISPVKQPELLRYLLQRRQGAELHSRFQTIIEPFQDTPLLRQIEQQDGAVLVTHADGRTDTLLVGDTPVAGIETDADVAVVTRDKAGKVVRVFAMGGSFLTAGGQTWRGQSLTGEVLAVDSEANTVRVRLEKPTATGFPPFVAHFVNSLRRTTHPIASAKVQGKDLVLTLADDLRIGRAPLKAQQGKTLTLGTELPLAAVYPGAAVLVGGTFHRITAATKTSLTLAAEVRLPMGQDLWLVSVAPGDRLEIPTILTTEPR